MNPVYDFILVKKIGSLNPVCLLFEMSSQLEKLLGRLAALKKEILIDSIENDHPYAAEEREDKLQLVNRGLAIIAETKTFSAKLKVEKAVVCQLEHFGEKVKDPREVVSSLAKKLKKLRLLTTTYVPCQGLTFGDPKCIIGTLNATKYSVKKVTETYKRLILAGNLRYIRLFLRLFPWYNKLAYENVRTNEIFATSFKLEGKEHNPNAVFLVNLSKAEREELEALRPLRDTQLSEKGEVEDDWYPGTTLEEIVQQGLELLSDQEQAIRSRDIPVFDFLEQTGTKKHRPVKDSQMVKELGKLRLRIKEEIRQSNKRKRKRYKKNQKASRQRHQEIE